jgi:hypothetical protein
MATSSGIGDIAPGTLLRTWIMAADNHTTIVGNLVEIPELRFTNNGTAVANLRVAVTQRLQQDGEWRDGTPASCESMSGGAGRALGRLPFQGRPVHGHLIAHGYSLGLKRQTRLP